MPVTEEAKGLSVAAIVGATTDRGPLDRAYRQRPLTNQVQPTLDQVVPEFAGFLATRAGETLVLAAHNVAFDVPVLRAELARVGSAPLADLPVLDTGGAIRRLAGLGLGHDRRLASLLGGDGGCGKGRSAL